MLRCYADVGKNSHQQRQNQPQNEGRTFFLLFWHWCKLKRCAKIEIKSYKCATIHFAFSFGNRTIELIDTYRIAFNLFPSLILNSVANSHWWLVWNSTAMNSWWIRISTICSKQIALRIHSISLADALCVVIRYITNLYQNEHTFELWLYTIKYSVVNVTFAIRSLRILAKKKLCVSLKHGKTN